jgi:acyl transferase domain-containing protein
MLAVAGDQPRVQGDRGIEGVWLPAPTARARRYQRLDRCRRTREALRGFGLEATSIPVQCAFHTPLMASARDRFAATLGRVAAAPLRFPVFSNATAAPYPAEASAIPERLLEQLVNPVRFAEEIEAMYAAGVRTFVEVGPNQVLTRLVQETLGARPHLAVHTGSRPRTGLPSLAPAVAGTVALDRLTRRDCAPCYLPALGARRAALRHLWAQRLCAPRRRAEPDPRRAPGIRQSSHRRRPRAPSPARGPGPGARATSAGSASGASAAGGGSLPALPGVMRKPSSRGAILRAYFGAGGRVTEHRIDWRSLGEHFHPGFGPRAIAPRR